MTKLIKRLIHTASMRLRGYKKGLTSDNLPSNFDLDAMPNGMRRGVIRHADYRKVWYKHTKGGLIKKEIKFL